MRVCIHSKGVRGYVDYNPYTREVLVSHEDSEVRRKVYRYLTTEQEFRVSGDPSLVGCFDNRRHIPTEASHWVELALCMLNHRTGVHVDWKDEGNYSDPQRKPTTVGKDINTGDSYEFV